MYRVGRAWNSKYNKNEIYFVFTIGGTEYKGTIGSKKCKLLYNDASILFVNNTTFKIKDMTFKLVTSTVKSYDYKVLLV